MKAVKIISSVILILLLLTAESFVMGIFSVDRAVSKESVYEAMEESNIVSELVDEALSEETVNMGGTYGFLLYFNPRGRIGPVFVRNECDGRGLVKGIRR